MKQFVVFLPALFFVTLLFSPAKAQTSVDACNIELSEPFSAVTGKVVRVGNTLTFVDDDLGRSVSVDKSNIKSLSFQKDVSSIYLHRPVVYRERDRLHFEFRVVTPSANCEAIKRWLLGGNNTSTPGNGRVPGRQPPPPVKPKTYQVVHKRFMDWDIPGTLSISCKMVEFDCPTDARRFRRWDLRDIKQVQQNGP
ncbi:MAG: hypothetical protein ACREEM_53310, partial [Blastocatellia bacterium]